MNIRSLATHRLFNYLTLAISCLGWASLPSWGEDKIVDVNVPPPYLTLPFEVDIVKHPMFYVACTIAEGRVKQESGPEAEVMTAYKSSKGWPVWVRLPDQTGEFVFSKVGTDDSAGIKVTDDKEHPYAHRVVIQPVKGSTAGAEAAPILIQRAVQIPLSGSVKQVSGPKTEVMTDKGNAWARIPDQVCTLIFEAEGKSDRAVIRVWADKDNRCFVSAKKGDDANSGTEDKPFKSLSQALKYFKGTKDKKGGIYMASGEYDMGDEKAVLDHRISLYGGFDDNGWRRDSMITESVLLPHAFCENWINDITDRYKDIRRGEPRYHETIILRRTTKRNLSTIDLGTGGGLQLQGTPDTYLDGVTIYGPDENSCGDGTMVLASATQNKRFIRNCMLIHFCGGGHNFMMSSCGDSHFENNLFSGGIDHDEDNNRPNITGTFGRWHRNLIMGPSGGHYTRILNMWGEGASFVENQVHGGESTQWTAMQAAHRAALAERVNVFRKNVFYLDFLFKHCVSAGLHWEDNDFYLFKGGVEGGSGIEADNGKIGAWKEITIMNNRFHLAPGVNKELWRADMVNLKLGGHYEFEQGDLAKEKYIEPEGEGLGKPTIENNKFITMEKADRRMGNLVDLNKLMAQGAKVGKSAFVRPKDPAKNLKAQATGGTVSLTWDESADSDVSGYIVRYGQKSNSYQNPTFFEKVKFAEIKNLQPGDWYFTVVPIKEGNVECWKLSNEVQVVVR
jgi:hypothetical protein